MNEYPRTFASSIDLRWEAFLDSMTKCGFETVYSQSYRYHAIDCVRSKDCENPVMVIALHRKKRLVLRALSIVRCYSDARYSEPMVGRADVYGTGRIRDDVVSGFGQGSGSIPRTWTTSVASHHFFQLSVRVGFAALAQLEKQVEFVRWLDANAPMDLQNYADLRVNEFGSQTRRVRAKQRALLANELVAVREFAMS